MLYRHALESIFGFCTLSELHQINAVSREWSAAVESMAHLASGSMIVRGHEHFEQILAGSHSALRRHVTAMQQADRDAAFVIRPLDHLARVSAVMPCLRSLSADPFVTFPEGLDRFCTAMPHFRRLERLCIELPGLLSIHYYFRSIIDASNRIIRVISQLNPTTLHVLDLQLSELVPELTFAPLAALSALRVLRLDLLLTMHSSFTVAQIAELRSLVSLEQLVWAGQAPAAESDFLVSMLQPVHGLRWTSLSEDFVSLSPALSAVLPSLPSLTELRVVTHCSDVSCLGQLRDLRTLGLVSTAAVFVNPADLTAALVHCTSLTRLTLTNYALLSRHMSPLLAALPSLSSLELYSLPLESLQCFDAPLLASTLTALKLCNLRDCAPTEIDHLLSLRALCSIEMGGFAAKIPADQETLFTSSSSHFPHLTQVQLSS